jgi:hypothetical protein
LIGHGLKYRVDAGWRHAHAVARPVHCGRIMTGANESLQESKVF